MKFLKVLLVIIVIMLIISAILSLALCFVFARDTGVSEYSDLSSILGMLGWGTLLLFIFIAGISIGYIFLLKHNFRLLEDGEGHSYNILLLVGRLFSLLIIAPYCIVSIFYYKDFVSPNIIMQLLYWFFINFIILALLHSIYSITFLVLSSKIKKQIRQNNKIMMQQVNDIHRTTTPYRRNYENSNIYDNRNPYDTNDSKRRRK